MDLTKFNAVLHMDDEQFAEKFIEALGLKPGETVEIVTPQFERNDGITPALPDVWERLKTLSMDTLKAIGCRPWSDPDKDGNVLMLFPYEWYGHIPEGFKIKSISGDRELFRHGETDDDKRGGVLAYGVEIKAD